MRLAAAARHFHRTQAYDGYTGAVLFQCHLSNFDDSASDGSTSRRRALHLAPTAAVPARRVVLVNGERWLVGGSNTDSFSDELLRRSYGMKKATDLAEIVTPGQACLGTAGVSAYIHRHYFREVVAPQNDSDIDTMWNVFLAPSEVIGEGFMLRIGEELLRVRNVYLPVEDLRIAQSDQLDAGSRVEVVLTEDEYLPAEDAMLPKTSATYGIVLEYTKLYQASITPESRAMYGDLSLLLAKSAVTPEVGKQVRFSYKGDEVLPWVITKRETEADCWLLKLKRV